MRFLNKKVLSLVAKIPKGKVATYGELAGAVKTGPRAVGKILGANLRPVVIPCHRVIKSDGSLGGYSGGIREKNKLLKNEGIEIKDGKVINLSRMLHKFKIGSKNSNYKN